MSRKNNLRHKTKTKPENKNEIIEIRFSLRVLNVDFKAISTIPPGKMNKNSHKSKNNREYTILTYIILNHQSD
jgi:hypothetical protein